MGETISFSRVEFQFPPNLDPLAQIEETIGFSRMESQFQPNQPWQQSTGQNWDSMRLKPMVSSVSSKQKFLRRKLKLHAAEAGSLTDAQSGMLVPKAFV